MYVEGNVVALWREHCCHGKTTLYSLGIFELHMSLSTVTIYLCFHVKRQFFPDFHQNFDFFDRL